MVAQLQINQGPQDALLYDNSRSYFTNVGYVRTSNFQVEYKDVDPQNNPQLGGTVRFVIPKAADLLGPVDLKVTLDPPSEWSGLDGADVANVVAGDRAWAQWVDEVGFAMIETVTFQIGNNNIETITGEQLQLKNELMTSDEMRLGHEHVLKTGRKAFADAQICTPGEMCLPSSSDSNFGAIAVKKAVQKDYSRLICYRAHDGTAATSNTFVKAGPRHLIIPLGLFFTKHVSQYFPLAAIAGCNDMNISIKFRHLKELVQVSSSKFPKNGGVTPSIPTWGNGGQPIPSGECKLRCQYVHVTGPEAQLLMNKEHVRLLKLYQHQFKVQEITKSSLDMDLSFLHPVSTLLITIRRQEDMLSDVSGDNAMQKGHFFYHGDGTNPNYDRAQESVATSAERYILTTIGTTTVLDPMPSGNAKPISTSTKEWHFGALNMHTDPTTGGAYEFDEGDEVYDEDGMIRIGTMDVMGTNGIAANFVEKPTEAHAAGAALTIRRIIRVSGVPAKYQDVAGTSRHTLKLNSIGLSINGTDRHSGLDKGVDTEYMQSRLLPMLHSNSNAVQKQLLALTGSSADAQRYGMQGSKNIFVYPFSLNPEGTNPAGAVNFSKVSHAKLRLHFDLPASQAEGSIDSPDRADIQNTRGGQNYRVDVYALYYNWLQIKDGRALLSFA